MTVQLPGRVAGDLALDLANTISWRGTARETDHLADAPAIIAWSIAAGLVEPDVRIAADEEAALVVDVLRLRAAITSAGSAIAAGGEPEASALTIIGNLAARTLAASQLSGVPAAPVFSGPDRIAGPLAWAALDLLRGGELDRLRICPPDDCHWLFLDRSKNRSRRWCDMSTCGNRAKGRRHADRRD